MIKKIIIASIICILIITTLALTFSDNSDLLVKSVVPITLIFAVFVTTIVLKKAFGGAKPKNEKLHFSETSNINIENLKPISNRPFFFGIEKKILSDEKLFYDNECLYAINKQNEVARFKLNEICSIKKTSVQINNHRIWEIKIIREDTSEIIFKFSHNYTIWNKNFPQFLELVKQINSNKVKTNFDLFSM